jgi:hypothetical protein
VKDGVSVSGDAPKSGSIPLSLLAEVSNACHVSLGLRVEGLEFEVWGLGSGVWN